MQSSTAVVQATVELAEIEKVERSTQLAGEQVIAGVSRRRAKAEVNQAARRAQILDAAAQLFDQEGYHETSVDRIAQAVSLSKPALYHYFRSKDEILSAIHETFTDTIFKDWEVISRSPDPADQLRQLCVSFLKVAYERRAYVRTFFTYFGLVNEGPRDAIFDRRNVLSEIVEQTLQRCHEAGRIRAVDAKLAMLFITGTFNWSSNWYHPDGPRSYEELGNFAFRMFMYGLSEEADPAGPGLYP